jgi:hypothetical protein
VDTDVPSTAKAKTKLNMAMVVAITLACVFVFEKLVGFVRTSDYEARAKRSEALLTAQEQRNPKYDEYYRHIEEDFFLSCSCWPLGTASNSFATVFRVATAMVSDYSTHAP